jgi:hypothetical protein
VLTYISAPRIPPVFISHPQTAVSNAPHVTKIIDFLEISLRVFSLVCVFVIIYCSLMCLRVLLYCTYNHLDISVPDAESQSELESSDIEEMLIKLRQSLEGSSATAVPAVINVLAANQTVVHIPQQRAFSVTGNDGGIHAVTLFPNETCTCPASTRCCHIIAALRSIGASVETRRAVKLSTMRKKSRLGRNIVHFFICTLSYLQVRH